MKFLVDNQLPAALVQFLRKHGVECEHVLDAGLAEASDAAISRYAVAQDLIIVSKDEDFFYLASQPDTRIRLLWVRLGNCRKAALLRAVEGHWPRIEECFRSGDRVVELR